MTEYCSVANSNGWDFMKKKQSFKSYRISCKQNDDIHVQITGNTTIQNDTLKKLGSPDNAYSETLENYDAITVASISIESDTVTQNLLLNGTYHRDL